MNILARLLPLAAVGILSLGCDSAESPVSGEPPADAAANAATAGQQHASGLAATSLATRLRGAMSAAGRPEEDRALDETRRPIQVLEFLGIRQGMNVLDVNAAAGYYTELLSAAVGPSGRVYAQNDPATLDRDGGIVRRELDSRLANDRLPNVTRLDEDLDRLSMDGQADAALLILTLHDFYNFLGEESTVERLRRILAALKPGGILGVIDHVGEASRTSDARELHRIDKADAERLVGEAGFLIDRESDLLSNPEDTHERSVFDESIRRRTDRFVLRAHKP